jgi:hypothetical protein
MIITLTWAQLQACRQWGGARHKNYLLQNRQRTQRGHECAMPAIAWRTLADRLMHEAYHASGHRRATHLKRHGAPATLSALQNLEANLARLQVHPAIRGEAVEGHSGDVLVAWPAERGYSIYPNSAEMVALVPNYETRNFTTFNMPITYWEPRTPEGLDVPYVFLEPGDHAGWADDAGEAVG